MNMWVKFLKIMSISFTLAACAPLGKPASEIANRSLDELGCKSSQSAMWESFHKIADDSSKYPSSDELRNALKKIGAEHHLRGAKYERYVDAFIENYNVTIEGIQNAFAPNDTAGWKKALAEMEIGVRVTEVHADLQDKIEVSLTNLAAAEEALNKSCAPPSPTPPTPTPTPTPEIGTVWNQLKATETPEVLGIRRTLATAYQSCDVLKLAPVSAATPNVQGVSVTGNHPSGGLTRAITNLAQVNASHYYINGQRLAKNSCFEVRNSPLIYDFGGKPYTSASLPYELNMFKNAGSGTSVLGIDCSAFVFSSLALAGLKLDPDPKKILKADLVHGIGSVAYMEPQSNGMRCLEKTTMTKAKSILPGDIVAINGHVQIVDSIGADPFGLARAQSVADCTSAKLAYTGFDFNLAQSSPSKNGIGINIYKAKDYLSGSSTFRDGLTAYALAACKAKFGGSGSVSSSALAVVRHKKTVDCLAPQPLVATNQSCVDECPAL